MNGVQTTIYRRTAPNHYEATNEAAVIGERIKILSTRRSDLKSQGAAQTILRDGPSSHLITGIIPIRGLSCGFYGDYHRETIGVYYYPEWPEILVVIFLDHRPKRRSVRATMVGEYFKKKELDRQKISPPLK